MARQLQRLTHKAILAKRSPGYYADGGGLYLQVGATGTKSWIFRYSRGGKAREMGLGALHTVPLAKARDDAATNRRLLHEGVDPITARDADRQRDARSADGGKLFKQYATAFIEANKPGWKNAKHAAQWENTLSTYAYPVIGKMPAREVETKHILQILQPIIHGKRETANRVRGRVEQVLNWAMKAEEREAPNPARWRGHLELMLPKDKKRKRVKHHPALPIDRLGVFMSELREQDGSAARALEFLILTAARTTEVIKGTPAEIEARQALWTVPAGRMKGEVEHRVPLTSVAVRLVKDAEGPYLFPGGKAGEPLSNMAMLALLDRMGYGEYTVHGFRSTFRDWAAERTNFPREVAEAALSHVISDETEAAYRRSDLFDKRRQLMDAWAKFCDRVATDGKVVPLHARR